MTALFADLLRDRFDEVAWAMVNRARKDSPSYAYSLSDEEIRKRGGMTLDAFIHALAGDPPTAYSDFWTELSHARFRSGVKLNEIQAVLLGCNATVRDTLKQLLAGEPLLQVQAVEACAAIAQGGILALYTAYERAKDEVIAVQQASIRQLSIPVIPVHDGVLVLPLVGNIDAERASDVLERLLDSIARAHAAVVIIDVTGVPVVDTAVAAHLIRAARASELLGAKVVFVGIRPATARALVELGVELSGLKTLANLQAGVAYALEQQGLTVCPTDRARGQWQE